MPTRTRTPIPLLLLGLLFSLLLGFTPATATPADAATLSQADLRAQVLYFNRVNNLSSRTATVAALQANSALEGRLWTKFLTKWDAANANHNTRTKLATNLPSKGHVFVVLGSALKADGTISARLVKRMELALAALKTYPKSDILVTGGAPKNGKTEGRVMYDWLLAKGIPASRILVEEKSSSTISNATGSIAILASQTRYTSYSLISDVSHIRRASVLFEAAKVAAGTKAGKELNLSETANYAYPDKTIPTVATDATHEVISSNVASVFGLLSAYNKLLATPPKPVATPPKAPVLVSLSLTPPNTVNYRIGQELDLTGFKVTASYSNSQASRDVTTQAKLTGFDSSVAGTQQVTVSYTEGGVTKSATFTTKVTRQDSRITVKASHTKLDTTRTRVTLTATVSAPKGFTPTGKVAFQLDGKTVKTVKLDPSNPVLKYKYAAIEKVGVHAFTASYAGDANLAGASKTLDLRVYKAVPTLKLVRTPSKVRAGLTKTRLTLTLAAPNQIPATGKVEFRLGTKVLQTVTLKTAGNPVKFTYPVFKKVGKYQLTAKYLGNSRLKVTSKTLKVTVVR